MSSAVGCQQALMNKWSLERNLPSVNLDTTTTTCEASWYDAAAHQEEVDAAVNSFDGQRDLDCLDLYGASKVVAKTFGRHRKKAVVYDIKLNGLKNDVCSRLGFFFLLALALRLKPKGICVGGPPCSLFIFLSSSVHRRCSANAWGNEGHSGVRLANMIVKNTIVVLHILVQRGVYVVIEQPGSSWMFKVPNFKDLISAFDLQRIFTYMGAFGHMMCKPSHLLSNLPTLTQLSRRLTPAQRRRIQERAKKAGKTFVRKINGSVCGAKDLQSSAEYTDRFCEALYQCWLRGRAM